MRPLISDQRIRQVATKVLLGTCVLWLGYVGIGLWLTNSAGTHGDMFGSLNALFSGLAFVGVIVAIFLQSRELELQREELRQSVEAQEELVEQAKKDSRATQAVRVLNGYADWLTAAQIVARPFGSDTQGTPSVYPIGMSEEGWGNLWRQMFDCIAKHNALAQIDPAFANTPPSSHPTFKLKTALEMAAPLYAALNERGINRESEELANEAVRGVLTFCADARARLHPLLPSLPKTIEGDIAAMADAATTDVTDDDSLSTT